MTETTFHQVRPVQGLVALILAVILALAIGLAITTAGNKSAPSDSWRFAGEKRSCSEVPLASDAMFAAWEDQCRT